MSTTSTESPWRDIRTAEVRGVKLSYRESGHGDPVVFVHGGLSDLRVWAHQLADLSDGYRAITLSRRYAPPNDDIPEGVDDQIVPQADDVAAFLEAVGAAPAHLVGNSWGGFVCLMTAIRHPRVVRSLALEEAAVFPLLLGGGARPHLRPVLASLRRDPRGTMAVLRFGAQVLGPVQKAFRAGDFEGAWRKFAEGVHGKEAFARMSDERRQQMRENATALRNQLLGAGFPALSADQVKAVTIPALLLSGADSPAFLRTLTDTLADLLPQAERVIIPDATHAMHEENPSAVNAALRAFLAKQR